MVGKIAANLICGMKIWVVFLYILQNDAYETYRPILLDLSGPYKNFI